MVKKLTRTGNSYALVLDRQLLEEAHLDPDTQVDVMTDGHVIVISPMAKAKDEKRFKEVTEQVFARYSDVFRKLAK